MKKILKWFLFIFLGLIAATAAAVIALKLFIDPNDYKDRISQLIEQQTGHRVNIPGNISLRISPNLDTSLELGAISIASPQEITDKPLLMSKQAALSVAVLPLLKDKQLVVNKLSMHSIDLVLAVNKQGQNNWMTKKLKQSGKDKPKQEPEGQKGKQAITGIDIGSIELGDINLRYHNDMDGTKASLTDFNLTTGRITNGKPFPLNTGFNLALSRPQQPDLQVKVAMSSNLFGSPVESRFTAKDTTLAIRADKSQYLPTEFDLKAKLNAEARLKEQHLLVELSTLELNSIQLDGKVALTSFTSPQVSGYLNLEPFSPRKVLEELNRQSPRTADASVLEKFGVSLDFKASATGFSTDTLQAVLDDTTISAAVVLNNFSSPQIKATVEIDAIDLDRYQLISPQQPVAATQPETIKKKQQGELIPVDLLRSLNSDIQLRVGTLKAAKTTMSDITAKISAHDGLLHLSPFAAHLYQGTAEADAKIDVRGESPVIMFNKSIDQVELGPLLTDLKGKPELTGTADIKINGTTQGNDRQSLIRNSNGKMSLSLTDGVITRLRILDTIRQAKALMEKKPLVSSAKEQPTGFAQLTATAALNNGIIVNNDLLAQSDLMKVTGKGKVDLNSEMIDYLLTVYLTDRVERQAETGLVALGNKPIPYRIKGKFSKIEQSAALGEILKTELEGVLLNELQKQLNKESTDKSTPQQKAPEENLSPEKLLQKGLKGLFGN